MYRLLVVDDEPRHRRCLAEMLRKLRPTYEICEARNGQEAMESMRACPADIIVTDVRMPILDGFGFLETMRGIHDSVRTVILSGYASFEYAQTAMKLGASDYVLKPVNEAKVRSFLERVESQIAEERQREREHEHIHRQLRLTLPVYMERLLNRLLQGRLSEAERQELGQILVLDDDMILILTAFRNPLAPSPEFTLDDANEMRMSIKFWMKEALTRFGHAISFFREQEGECLVTLLHPGDGTNGRLPDTEGIAAALKTFVSTLDVNYALESACRFESVSGGLLKGLPAVHDSLWATLAGSSAEPLPESPPEELSAIGARTDRIICSCMDFLSEHYCEDLSLDAIAGRFGFNSSYFSSYFRINTGQTFSDYLLDLRMTEAKRLLVESDSRIYEIATRIGYRDSRYFDRVFKKTAGISPDAYRRLARCGQVLA